MKKQSLVEVDNIQDKIHTIRGLQVMLDSDLAQIYSVETKNLNRAVSRNVERFPEKFRFQLTEKEFLNLRFHFGTSNLVSQAVTPKQHGGRRYYPYVFTEQGVSMLSAVLRSKTAIKVSIQIMDAFVNMRKFILTNAQVFQRLDSLEIKQLAADKTLNQVLNAIESKEITPKQGIFFDGQVFDAYKFVSKLIRSANKSIILMDNYIDDTVLTHFEKRKKNVSLTILTRNISKKLKLDVEKFNRQYKATVIKEFNNTHDRFLIVDETNIYHFGASLKDLGKKWFAFSKMDVGVVEILGKVRELV